MKNKNSSITLASRCQFQFSDGRSCRMLRTPAHPSFCAFHARPDLELLESQRLGDEISATLNGDFLTATDINHVLGKLFTAAAQNRISLRKAAVLTYIGRVMLSSLPHVKREFPFSYKFDHWTEVLANAAPLSTPPIPHTLLGPPSLPDSPVESPTDSISSTDSNSFDPNSVADTGGISPARLPGPPDPASPEEHQPVRARRGPPLVR